MNNNVSDKKIAAFRDFAATLAGQVVEQLCTEFEREVGVMYKELVQYRNELGRVAELLGHQLGREKQLHEMLDTMANHHSSVAAQAAQMAANKPNSSDLHNTVDQVVGGVSQVSGAMLGALGQANEVLKQHSGNANMMKEQTITAEHEFQRLMDLLSKPMISMATPGATSAMLPNMNAAYRPTSGPTMGSPYRGTSLSSPLRSPGGAIRRA